MKIGILGSGAVAQTLGEGFLRHGHSVMLGTRDPAKLSDWTKANPSGKVGSVPETGAFGETLVLAIKGSIAVDVLDAVGDASLRGKTVLDTTNPIANEPPQRGI